MYSPALGVEVAIGADGADDQIIDAVAVDVARSVIRVADAVAHIDGRNGGIDAVHAEAVRAVEALEVEADRRRRAKDHEGGAGIRLTVRIVRPGPDDHVIDAVIVDVARIRHVPARMVARPGIRERDPGRAEIGDVDGGREALVGAEDDVGFARVTNAAPVGEPRAHDNVVDAVVVEVARARDRAPQLRAVVEARNAETVGSVKGRGVDDGRQGVGSEDHVRLAGIIGAGIGLGTRHDDVADPVTVDVARFGDPEAQLRPVLEPLDENAVRAVETRPPKVR